MTATSKRCPRCRLTKPVSEFYARKTPRYPGETHNAYCRPCLLLYQKVRNGPFCDAPEIGEAFERFEQAYAELNLCAVVLRKALRDGAESAAEARGVEKRRQTRTGGRA